MPERAGWFSPCNAGPWAFILVALVRKVETRQRAMYDAVIDFAGDGVTW